jgi:excisionase family DNA binding protein
MASSAEDFLEDLIERIAARVVARMPQPLPQPVQAAPAEYLTTKDAAKMLGVGCSTLEVWRANGKGPPAVKISDSPGGAVRYSRADLDSYIAERRARGEKRERRSK